MSLDGQHSKRTNGQQGDVAIVGMGCLFAGAPDVDAFWRNILSKFDAVTDPPEGEWDTETFYDPKSKANDRVYCKRGGYIGDLSQFRPSQFGVMPVAIDGGEPDQWLALRVAQEALADAGYTDFPKEHLRTEVVLGKGTYINRGNLTVGHHAMLIDQVLQILKNLHPDYEDSELQEIKEELKGSLPPFGADTAPALIGNIIAGRIANRLDLMGPSFTVDAACASALLAIEIAVHDLLSHKYDLVLAGGVNINAPLPTLSLFCQLGALSRREQIRPFDKMADGTILGEGLGMIVLKRREDAERDGDRIYAVIKGVGIASDGRALHVMAPRLEGEELALRRAFEMAGFSPESVGLIEAHGTATPLGDLTEVQALRRVFGERQTALPVCALGSVKSNIGHTMPAAGIAGVIKTALSLYHRVLPPTLNCDEPNPALDLDKTPFYVNTEVRPWIHALDTPRRAGVNSFGFGGINAHVLLEEHPDEKPCARNHQIAWETEVFILEGESRPQLIENLGQLKTFLERSVDPNLKDLAYSMNTALRGRPSRLALVGGSVGDLLLRVNLALVRLADSRCHQIKDNSGVYFFEQPLQGKLAMLFPGEGAQYPNMLLDLCLHFPEVRQCFDTADRVLMLESRKVLPSEFIFPRSILSEAEGSETAKALWQIEGAVQSVMVANRAMWTLFRQLKIQPDVIAGHSTGDYSAMVASQIVGLQEMIGEWDAAHARLGEKITVPEVTLLALATDSKTALSVAEHTGGELYLAMDNCPHQSVLAGSRGDVEKVIEELRRRAIIYEILPFDRPYHTPLFQEYAEGAGREFFARLEVKPPKTITYSCTTAAPYPDDVDEIRKLFVAHWVLPVRFADTIKRMYEDGVRVFVEAGPRGNLTAFVSDVLRGKPHLAMPANLPRRSGITQINHLVGVLAAQGREVALDYLYSRRDPKRIDWQDNEPAAMIKPLPTAMKLPLFLPALKVAPRARKPVPQVEQQAPQPLTVPITPVNGHSNGITGNGRLAVETPAKVFIAPHPTASHPTAPQPVVLKKPSPRASEQVMQEYFKGMQSFLDVETEVMTAFLQRHSAAKTSGMPAAPKRELPFVKKIISITPLQDLVAECSLSLEEHLFLRDHALGGAVSAMSPGLRPLIVLPMTMGMEILAEAASALMPTQLLTGMRDVQAHHWIQVGDNPASLKVSARRLPGPSGEVAVQIWNATELAEKNNGRPVMEGIVVFSEAYPSAPFHLTGLLEAERKSTLDSAVLYDGRLMFHGPAFQGVQSIERSGQNGLSARLVTLPVANLLHACPSPHFITDPVALDAAGQLVGFWAAEYLDRGFVVFPYHLEKLHVYGPNRPAGEKLSCRIHLQLKGSEGIRSDIEIALLDGTVWMRLQGWLDRRFDPPPQFHRAWVAPREATVSEPWEAPLRGIPEGEKFECYRLNPLFEPGASFWIQVWASLVLTGEERKAFGEHKALESRKLEWLSGRTAAKDAIRSFLMKHYRCEVLAADIEIQQDEFGKPGSGGAWERQVPATPSVSIAHSNGIAVALAGPVEAGLFGFDIETIRELKPDFEALILSGPERKLLDAVPVTDRAEWTLRLWCVKEAVSKAVGRGLIEGAASVSIQSLNPQSGIVDAMPQGKLAEALPNGQESQFRVYTIREGAQVAATALQRTTIS